MAEPIYFDNSATTPLDPRVTQAMVPLLGAGNPSSLHWAGQQAREAVELARCQVAVLLNAQPNEIIFTASGTEADNLALSGVIEALGPGDHHLITSAIEHKLLLALDAAGIAISTGSACSAHHATEPSYILRALGFDPLQARGSLRITLGRFNTAAEIDRFLEVLPPLVGELRPITSHRWAIA